MIQPDWKGLQGEMTVALDNTITEQDMDASTRQYLQGLPAGGMDIEPDLDIDGLSDSFFARIRRFLSFGRA